MPGFLLSLQRLMFNVGGGEGGSWRELLRFSVFFFSYLALYPFLTWSLYLPVTPSLHAASPISDPPPSKQHLLASDPLLPGILYLPVTHSIHIASAHQCEDFRKEMELSILSDWNGRGFSIDRMQLFNLDCSQSQHSCDHASFFCVSLVLSLAWHTAVPSFE